MARPTIAQINSKIRDLLGDTEVAGGQEFTDARNFYAIKSAWTAMIQAMVRKDISLVQTVAYVNIPAYTSSFIPTSVGIYDMGAPTELRQRSVGGSRTVLSVALASSGGLNHLDCTLDSPHGLSDGANVVVFKAAGMDIFNVNMNGAWTITVPSPSVARLMGCEIIGNYTNNSATLSWSMEEFNPNPIPFVDIIHPRQPMSTIQYCCWRDGKFYISPANNPRQLQIQYLIFSEIPDTFNNTLPVDGCLEFLSHYAAAQRIASVAEGTSAAAGLYKKACGSETGEFSDMSTAGGFLGNLLVPGVKQNQLERVIMPRFRPVRNLGTMNYY
jgi:hypothetical protein